MRNLGIWTISSSLLIALSFQPSAQAETVMTIADETTELPKTEQPHFGSPLEERLHIVGKTLYEKRESYNGQYLQLQGKSLGKIPVATLEKGGIEVKRELARILQENSVIVGDVTGYEFEVSRVGIEKHSQEYEGPRPSAIIVFHQVINGLDAPRSLAFVSMETSDVLSLSLVAGDPSNPAFERTNWLSEDKLHEILRSTVESQLGSFEESYFRGSHYKIVGTEDGSVLTPVWEVSYGTYVIQIAAETGALVRMSNLLSFMGETQCEDDGTLPTQQHFNCDDPADMVVFKINGVCQAGHPACGNTKYTRAVAQIQTYDDFGSDRGFPGPSDYDIMFKARMPVLELETAWFFPDGIPKEPIIGLGQVWVDAPQKSRDDGVVHEWAHSWHWQVNRIGYDTAGGFGNVYAEAVADTYLAFATGDNYIVWQLSGTGRNLDSGRDYTDITFLPLNVTNDSLSISELFVDIRKKIGANLGYRLFVRHVVTQDPSSDGDASQYSIDDFRIGLRQLIYSELNKSQRAEVCSLWTSKQFPGTLCEKPSTPSGMLAINTGACVTAWSPSQQQYIYGSQFYFQWQDVDREDHYDNCIGNSPIGPWSCLLVAGQNGTSSLPHMAMTNGTGYVGVRACNESGCSPLNIISFLNTCPQPPE